MKKIDKRKYVIDEDEFRGKFPEIEGKILSMFFSPDKRELEVEVEL